MLLDQPPDARPCPPLCTGPIRTDPLQISDSVVDKVAEMLAEEGDPALQLRIFVTGGGCSGFQYGFCLRRRGEGGRRARRARQPSPWWSTR
jgi:hypothetical protein